MIKSAAVLLNKQFLSFKICSILILFCVIQNAAASNYDKSKFCNPSAGTVFLLVDITSSFDDIAHKSFFNGVSKILSNLHSGERIVISTIEESFTKSSDLFEGCVPYCSDTSIFSSCTTGLVILETRKQKKIIANVLNKLLNNSIDLPSSDIIRTIYFKVSPHHRHSEKIQIYVFSDLIENSDFLSGRSFIGDSNEKNIQKLKTNKLIPDLSKATVKIFGFGRSGKTDRAQLNQKVLTKIQDFWQEYFSESGVKLLEINESLVVY